MKKTPLEKKKETKAEPGPQDADNDLREIEKSLKDSQEVVDKWQKRLNEWWAYLDAAKKVSLEIPGKLPLIIFALIFLSGCQTLSHPNTGPEVADKFWNSYPYFNQPVYPQPVYYPLPDYGVSRNDFIIATDGGF